MTRSDAIEHFGSQASIARVLGIAPAAVAQWGELVPPLRQLQLEIATAGKLRADASCKPETVLRG